jgi:hypothetical protein
MKPARDRHGLQAGVDAERAQEVADVISHRLLAEVQLVGDLRRRAAVLQQT